MHINQNIINIITERPEFWQLQDIYDSYITALIEVLTSGILTPGFKLTKTQTLELIKTYISTNPEIYLEYEQAFAKDGLNR